MRLTVYSPSHRSRVSIPTAVDSLSYNVDQPRRSAAPGTLDWLEDPDVGSPNQTFCAVWGPAEASIFRCEPFGVDGGGRVRTLVEMGARC